MLLSKVRACAAIALMGVLSFGANTASAVTTYPVTYGGTLANVGDTVSLGLPLVGTSAWGVIGYFDLTAPASVSFTGTLVTSNYSPYIFALAPVTSDSCGLQNPGDTCNSSLFNLGPFLGAGLWSSGTSFSGPLTAGRYIAEFFASGSGTPTGTFTGSVTLQSVTAVPEPATFALFGLGLAGLAGVRRRLRA